MIVFTDVLLNDLRDDFCVVLDDDFVMVFDDDMVADDVREQVENTVSKTVRDSINDFVRGFFAPSVGGNALKTHDLAEGDGSVFLVAESVVRQVIDIVLDELGPAAVLGRTELGRLQRNKRSAVAVRNTPLRTWRTRVTRLQPGSSRLWRCRSGW